MISLTANYDEGYYSFYHQPLPGEISFKTCVQIVG